MKKFLALIAALVMVFAVSATALAADDQVHNGTLPYESQQAVQITIKGLHAGGEDDGSKLPSEYHVRVKWDCVNGAYNATATDSKDGFQNFTWDCVTLQYEVNSASSEGADVRSGNWSATPKVAVEVTNASTPDLKIAVTTSLDGSNAWASLLGTTTLESQMVSNQVVEPVLHANMGSGVNSYEQGQGNASHNVYYKNFTLDWNYDALNQAALDAYVAGTGSQTLTNTFVVKVSAGN